MCPRTLLPWLIAQLFNLCYLNFFLFSEFSLTWVLFELFQADFSSVQQFFGFLDRFQLLKPFDWYFGLCTI